MGCNRSGGMLGSTSPNGNNDEQESKHPQPQKKGAQSQPDSSEPQNSVNGRASAPSDRGSADAVAHRSVAQPGAPVGTVPQDSAPPAAHPGPPR